MKLIDMLVEDGLNGWKWPDGIEAITQDNGYSTYKGVAFGYAEKPYLKGNIWLANNGTGHADAAIKRYDVVADDWSTSIITREQYEAALAASKRCDHKWVPSEGRTQSGYLCSKCGNYDGPGYDWIDWPGGECPVPTGTLVDVKWRDGRIDDGIPAKIRHDLDSSKRNVISWQHHGNSHDIVAYRLHKPQEAEQAKADDEADLNECIGQAPAPVWNGEGLPPVGCECEYSLNGGSTWWKCKIDYIVGTQGVVMLCDTFEGVQYVQFSSYGDALKFRPIRSEADIKRHDAAQALCYAGGGIGKVDESAGIGSCWFDVYDAIAAGKIPGVKLDD